VVIDEDQTYRHGNTLGKLITGIPLMGEARPLD
jgi:hypothetical protein